MLCLLTCICLGFQINLEFKDKDLKIYDSRFDFLKLSSDFSFTGVKLLKLPDGNLAVVSVASKVLTKPNLKDELSAVKVCEVKALKEFVGFSTGVQISSVKIINEKTIVTIDNDKQDINVLTEHIDVTKLEIKGLVQGMSKIGEWRSVSQNDTFLVYVAMGKICDKKGKTVFPKVE